MEVYLLPDETKYIRKDIFVYEGAIMKTRFTLVISLMTIFALLLAGCSSAATATVPTSNSLSGATKLALGTLKLEGTSQAVTAAQATELLTLWQAYASLSKSDTASQVELDALVKQIQGVMTADQLQAIEAMNLTEQAESDVMQSLGTSANTSVPVSTQGSTTLSQTGPGGGPGGMPGGGGDSVMSAIDGGVTTQSTPAVTQASPNVGSTQVNSMLIQALIQMLETRSQTTG
jgi:uncharacterized protein YceK